MLIEFFVHVTIFAEAFKHLRRRGRWEIRIDVFRKPLGEVGEWVGVEEIGLVFVC